MSDAKLLFEVFGVALGSGFAAGGWLGFALGRGHRAPHDAPRTSKPKPAFVSLPKHRQEIPVIPLAEPKARRVPTVTVADGRGDVVAALTALGFKKAEAVKAVDACEPSERSSVEMWIAAALRRVVR